jgi:HAD superfamily hydrolase (TIGR01484 family)
MVSDAVAKVPAMRNINDITDLECASIRGVLFDIDDTFTLSGKLIPEAFSALWDLHRNGLILAPITGRPAGWCDHIARMWPVDSVIGENGAFYNYYDADAKKLRQRYVFSPEEMTLKRKQLEAIEHEILRRVPRARISSDQPFRLFDVAIDYTEDISPLTRNELEEICRVFSEHKAAYKVSSIHVNGWFGEYTKLTTTRLFLEERFSISWDEAKRTFLFMGDSLNDEPMFQALDMTVGVANIRNFADRMKHLPKYVTNHEGGLGFAETASIILKYRHNKGANI